MAGTGTVAKSSIIVVIGMSEVRLHCQSFFIGHFETNVDLLHVKWRVFQNGTPLTCTLVVMCRWLKESGP
jgi:hypothetical protein